MNIFNALKITFWFFPLMVFAEQERISLCLEELIHSHCCERIRREASLPIHVECSYPIFPGKDAFIEQVNQHLKTEVENCFNCFIQKENPVEEIGEDGCTLSYELFPAFQGPNLISVFGYDCQIRGCHGCTYYVGKTFWRKENSLVKLVLDDLFVKGSGYRQFLLQYCENHFKSSGYGYYSSRTELPPELSVNDLDIFVPTNKGLVIIFRAYTVGGWADGPDTILIPYSKLAQFIDPLGPLKDL